MNALAILTRSPSDPRIKARLSAVLPSNDDRRELALAFLDDLVETCRKIPKLALRVAVTPPAESLRFSRSALPADMLVAQRGAAVGDRERNVLIDLARAGFEHIVLLGSDIPDLPLAHIEQAFAALEADPANIAIGPDDDGTYYLLGVTARQAVVPDIFTDVRSGTPFDLDDTKDAATRAGLTPVLLPKWHDVDSPEDLTALTDRLRYAPDTAPHTSAMLRKLLILK